MTSRTEKPLCHAMPLNLSPGPVEFFIPKRWPVHFPEFPREQARYESLMKDMQRLLLEAVTYGLWLHNSLFWSREGRRYFSPWQALDVMMNRPTLDSTIHWRLVPPVLAIQELHRQADKCGHEAALLEVQCPSYRQWRGKNSAQIKAMKQRDEMRKLPEYERLRRLEEAARTELESAFEEIRHTIPEQMPHCLVAIGLRPDEQFPPSTQGNDHEQQDSL